MRNSTEKVKKCAVELLKKLGYDVEEIDPMVVASTCPPDEQFSVFLDEYRLEFKLKDPSLLKKSNIKRRLDVLNSRFRECLKEDKP